MSAEIIINVTPGETRIALLENGVLQEVLVERACRRGLVGNIYKGRICRVLPGMQAAFVDIGMERAGFLHASDLGASSFQCRRENVSRTGEKQENAASDPSAEESGQKRREDGKTGARPGDGVTSLLREGGEIVVQVVKDPIGTKGARLSTQISIPSYYTVYFPYTSVVGVSQRIGNEQERVRLKAAVQAYCARDAMPDEEGGSTAVPHPRDRGAQAARGGYIVRTAAEGMPEAVLQADMEFLQKFWALLEQRMHEIRAPGILHQDLPLAVRTLREFSSVEIDRIRIDAREEYEQLLELTRQFMPEMISRIQHYTGERPIFDLYCIDDEIQKALDRRVQLKSGGHLFIDQTEAMTTIDVNTGAYVGHKNLEETIFKTNLEAAQAIARQLRLRNLGGIIIVDFIDMDTPEHWQQVVKVLEKSLRRDHTKVSISEVSSLGLVQLTRQRIRENLSQILCETCPSCSGSGKLKTRQTVCYEIFREILREARQFDGGRLLVLASQEIIDTLHEESAGFAELEIMIGKPIEFRVENFYTREQYDVIPLSTTAE